MKPWKAELFLVANTVIWGGTFLFTKLGIAVISPSLFLIARFLIALVLALAFFGKHLKDIDRKLARDGMILGIFFGIGFVLQTYGLQYTEVTKSSFITGLAVPITPFVFWFIVRRKVMLWPKIGVVVATFGLYVFTNPTLDNFNIGDILTLASTVFWALYITYMDVYSKSAESLKDTATLVVFQFVAVLPISLVSFFLFDYSTFYFDVNWQLVIAVAFNGVLASFGVTFIHTRYQRYTTPVKAALIFSLEPVFASIFALLVINEILSTREYTGAAILFTGVLISELGSYFQIKLKKKKALANQIRGSEVE